MKKVILRLFILFSLCYIGAEDDATSTSDMTPVLIVNPEEAKDDQTSIIPEGFVLVKAGSFTMGSPEREEGRFDNETQHQVTLTRDFYMAKYEVTQGQWEELMGTSLEDQNNVSDSPGINGSGSNYPMYHVSWYDSVEYCNALSRREGLTPVYSGTGENINCNFNADGYRLPTEAEWEYAARGGDRMGSYQIYSGSNSIGNVGWFWKNSGDSALSGDWDWDRIAANNGRSHPV
jgi:formylglycine-generating enzyme required for sulfatase activity